MKPKVLVWLLAGCAGQASRTEPTEGPPAVETGSTPIVVEQVYDAPVDRVWQAITDPNEMPQWFFSSIERFEPDVGFETRFIVEADGQSSEHVWTVTEVVPRQTLVYRWAYEGIPGDTTVRWELTPTPAGTRLEVTHTGHETFPRDNPVFSREACMGGWRYFRQDSLRAFLAGPSSEPEPGV